MKNEKNLDLRYSKIPKTKISLIKSNNKKEIFNTSELFIKKQKKPQIKKIIFNNSKDNTYIQQKKNKDIFPINNVRRTKINKNINNDKINEQINIMKLQMSCNILNQKISQLRNFSKEIDSYSYDKIKKNSYDSNINGRNFNLNETNINNTNRDNSPNYFSNYIGNKKKNNTKINLNSTTKRNFFHHPKLSFNNIIYNQKYLLKKFNFFNEIHNNNKYYGKYLLRNKNISQLSIRNKNNNNNNNFDKFNTTERNIINIPIILDTEETIKNRINIEKNKRMNYYLYNNNKNNNLMHKRFNSNGLNYSYINLKNKKFDKNNENIVNISMNNDNQNSLVYKYHKENKNNNYINIKNKNGVGEFDNFFLKDKSLFFIENSCNYNIVNQNSIELTARNNSNGNTSDNNKILQIEESSKFSFIISKNNINNNRNIQDNKDNKNNFKNISLNSNFDKNITNLNNKKILIPVNSINFSIKNEIKSNGNNINNLRNTDKNEEQINIINGLVVLKENLVEKKDINNQLNNKENIKNINHNKDIEQNENNENRYKKKNNNSPIKEVINQELNLLKDIKDKKEQKKEINLQSKENIEKEEKKVKEDFYVIVDQKDIKHKNNTIIHKSKEFDLLNIYDDRYFTEGKLISYDSELDQEKEQEKKIEKKRIIKTSPNVNKKVLFDISQTKIILYDLNNPASKIDVYDIKGNKKKINQIKLFEYKKRLCNNENKKLKSNLINCKKINYKKIIDKSLNKNSSKNQSKIKINKVKKIEISPNSIINRNLKKKHLNFLCDSIIKTIGPSSESELIQNFNEKEKINIKFRNNKNYFGRNKLINSYDNSIKKVNKNKERKNSKNSIHSKESRDSKEKELKRKKAKEKILSALETIKKYFEDID